MCNWEQAWLAYEPIENQKNRKFFESVYTDQNGELVKTALQEIETASEKLFNIHIAKTEDRNKAGILLEINPTLDLGREGYAITEESISAQPGKTDFCTEPSGFFSWFPQEKRLKVFPFRKFRRILSEC